MRIIRCFCAAFLALAANHAGPAGAQPANSDEPAVKLTPGERTAPPEVQNSIIEARKEIAAENKNYKVGLNPAALRPRSQLLGEIDEPLTSNQKQEINRKAQERLDLDRSIRSAMPKKKLAAKGKKKKVCDPKMTRFDWRVPKKMTPVRDQKACGSCWAFSAWGAYESSYLIVNRRSVDGSEQDLIDCAVSDDGTDAGDCDGGASWLAFEHMARAGSVKEATSPYTTSSGAQCKSSGKRPIKTLAWGFVDPTVDLPSVNDLKAALCEHGALSVSMRVVSEDFVIYERGVYDEPMDDPSAGSGHAVVLVGWDDTKDNGQGKKGAWLIKNSWGVNWGEYGYGWMSYGSNLIGRRARWVQAFEDQMLPAWKEQAPQSPIAANPAPTPAKADADAAKPQ